MKFIEVLDKKKEIWHHINLNNIVKISQSEDEEEVGALIELTTGDIITTDQVYDEFETALKKLTIELGK